MALHSHCQASFLRTQQRTVALFGHVKILFLSLLSKSLPIKGREARPGRERGNHGRTPPNRLVVTPIMASRSEKRSRGRADRIGSSRLVVHEDPAPAIAKQGLSRGALDDGDAEESERSDAIARGRVGRFF